MTMIDDKINDEPFNAYETFATPWFLRRNPSLKRIKTTLKVVRMALHEETKGDDELLLSKYPEANLILQAADNLLLSAEVVDEGLYSLLAKMQQYQKGGY